MAQGPIADSYWVTPQLLAGEYPGDLEAARAAVKLAALQRAGVSLFLDLTEEGELLAYDAELGDARHQRFAIRDAGVTDVSTMSRILNAIDSEIERGGVVYVHCWGGIGRTGTVVGCWLVHHGLMPRQALNRIAELRQDIPDAWKVSPETSAQRRMILNWQP